MAECNATNNSAGDVCVRIDQTSTFYFELYGVFGRKQKLMFKICRLPGSNFSTKYSTMGLLSTGTTPSSTPIVRSDLQVDNFLQLLDKDHPNAVAPCRALDALHSSKEPRVASTHDGREHEGGRKNSLCSKVSICSMSSLNNVQQLHRVSDEWGN